MISFLLAPVVPFINISPQNSFRILKTFRVQNPQEEEFRLLRRKPSIVQNPPYPNLA